MKKALRAVLFLFIVFAILSCAQKQDAPSPASGANGSGGSTLIDTSGREYYMVTFASGVEYWKGCYAGFQKAAALYGAKTAYDGTNDLDVNHAVTILEQIIAKNPAGIAVTCLDADAYIEPINAAIAKGIAVVTFDADAPLSKRYTYLGTGNENAGSMAAAYMANLLNHRGDVAIISVPGILAQEQRANGFKNYIEAHESGMRVVQIANGEADQTKSAAATAAIIQTNPNIGGLYTTSAQMGIGLATAVEEAGKAGQVKIISFDTDKATLDSIKAGTISASVVQGTGQMGYWAFEMLYHTAKGLVVDDWQSKGLAPLPSVVDTGVSFATKDNADSFY
jgi:ribose transport system substrate-binding protein